MNFNFFSNQQVINAFYYAVRKLNEAGQSLDAWNLIKKAKLQTIAEQRREAYNCPPIDQLPLKQDVLDAVLAELSAMQPEFQNSAPTVPDILLGVPWVSQLDANSPEGLDCGQACVSMLLKYYDNPPSPQILSHSTVEELVELMRNIDVRNGLPRRAKNYTNGPDLVELAAANGLTLTNDSKFASTQDAIAILNNRRPIIALVNYQDLQFPIHLMTGSDQGLHWLVIIGYSGGGTNFIVNDPLWTPSARNERGGGNLEISQVNLSNALRLHSAVH